jgi:hypothetical protein
MKPGLSSFSPQMSRIFLVLDQQLVLLAQNTRTETKKIQLHHVIPNVTYLDDGQEILSEEMVAENNESQSRICGGRMTSNIAKTWTGNKT